MAGARSKPTMLDVANLAGVSQSTVSLVLNAVEGARISSETRARVLDASRDLGYRNPDAYRIPVTATIGLVIDALSPNWLGAHLVDALRDYCAERGAQLLVTVTGGTGPDFDTALDTLLRAQPLGILLASIFPRQLDVPSRLAGVPTVLVNAYEDEPTRPAILPDFHNEARIGIQHILDLGHRRIAFLNLEEWHVFTRDRQAAIDALLDEAGIARDRALIRHLDGSPTQARAATARLLEDHPDVTAIVCASDRLAYGALAAAMQAGRRVGGDLSIIGHDDMPGAAETHPPLTTVRTRVGRIARLAIDALVEGRQEAGVTSVQGDLISRATCGPVPPDR